MKRIKICFEYDAFLFDYNFAKRVLIIILKNRDRNNNFIYIYIISEC